MANTDKRYAFTLIETIVVVFILIAIGVFVTVNLLGDKNQNAVAGGAAQMTSVLRQAESSAASGKNDQTWGVYFSASATDSFYALVNSSTYSSSTVVATYPLPSTFAYVTSTLTSGQSLMVTFAPITGISSVSTTFTIYSTGEPSLTEDISISKPGEIAYGPGAPPLNTGFWDYVPGNSTFGTSNFYVMKYAADCSDGLGDVENTSPNGTEQTYNNYNIPCDSASHYQIGSFPEGWPIVSLNQATAESLCQGIGAHLMTDAEWQTVAWNLEQVPSNWSGGAVGSGAMYIGKDDGQPAAYAGGIPSASDSLGYYQTDGPVSGGGSGTGGSVGATQRRTLTLSNGDVIWDFGSNIFEWLSTSILEGNVPYGSVTSSLIEFPQITNWGTLSQQLVGPESSVWTSAQGIGTFSSLGSSVIAAASTTDLAIVRGTDWRSAPIIQGVNSPSGVNAFNFEATSTYWRDDVGFRCAETSTPAGIQNIWVVDADNNRVEEFNTNGTYIGQLTGFSFPSGVAVDASGNVWIVDNGNNRVQEFAPGGTSPINQIGGVCPLGICGPPPSYGAFNGPDGIAIDPTSGDIWISDYYNNRVVKFTSTGQYLYQLGCSSGVCAASTTDGMFTNPAGLGIDASGNLWVTDDGGERIEKFGSSGTSSLLQVGCPSNGCANGGTNGEFDDLQSFGNVAVDSGGNIWVPDTDNERVQKFNSSGSYVSQLGCTSNACNISYGNTTTIGNAQALAFDESGDAWVVDQGGNRIVEFGPNSNTPIAQIGCSPVGSSCVGGSTNGAFEGPDDIFIK